MRTEVLIALGLVALAWYLSHQGGFMATGELAAFSPTQNLTAAYTPPIGDPYGVSGLGGAC